MQAMFAPPNGLPRSCQLFQTYSGWLLTTRPQHYNFKDLGSNPVLSFRVLWWSLPATLGADAQLVVGHLLFNEPTLTF
jgi:hypothetical protein